MWEYACECNEGKNIYKLKLLKGGFMHVCSDLTKVITVFEPIWLSFFIFNTGNFF